MGAHRDLPGGGNKIYFIARVGATGDGREGVKWGEGNGVKGEFREKWLELGGTWRVVWRLSAMETSWNV